MTYTVHPLLLPMVHKYKLATLVLPNPFHPLVLILFFITQLTQSHDIILTFTKGNVTLKDKILGQTICDGCESFDLYHLYSSSLVCALMISLNDD